MVYNMVYNTNSIIIWDRVLDLETIRVEEEGNAELT